MRIPWATEGNDPGCMRMKHAKIQGPDLVQWLVMVECVFNE